MTCTGVVKIGLRQSTARRSIVAASVALSLTACIPEQARLPDLPPPEPSGPAAAASPPPAQQAAEPASELHAWEPRPVTPNAVTVTPSTHIVAAGETLLGIGNTTGAGADAIARANGLRPPYVLRPGDRLIIPAGRYHLVRQGESGLAIARAYGVEWSRIVDTNGLTDPYILRAGQRIVIPHTGVSASADPQARHRLDINDLLTGTAPAVEGDARIPAPLPPGPPPQTTTGPSFAWPITGKIIQRFGRGANGERHDGIEISARPGTSIAASADGVVAFAGEGVPGLGGVVIVKHPGGWATVYGHASKVLVARDTAVKRGQPIALSGDTGFAERPQLHFEIRKGRQPVDPVANLPSR